jgi:probable rRNA maturation factor
MGKPMKTASDETSRVEIKGLPATPRGLARLVGNAARAVLDEHGVKRYVISLAFVSDRTMAGINRKALGRRGTTDVIAFDLSERGLPAGLVGDIYVSLGRARRQSAEFGVSLSEEIARLTIHGILHVVGYRDHTGQLKREMEARQERAVKKALKRFKVQRRL